MCEMKKTMLLVAMVVVGMMSGGCSRDLWKAKRDAEIERLSLENQSLRRDIGRGITLNGPGFDAILSGSGHDRLLERVIPEMIGEEAAKAELYRMKTAAIKRAVFSEGAVSRDSTKKQFWIDEMGQEWVRGYIENIWGHNIYHLQLSGIDDSETTVPRVLRPGDKILNFWGKVGTTICVTGKALDGNGGFVGDLYVELFLPSWGMDTMDKVDGKYYHWRIVVGRR